MSARLTHEGGTLSVIPQPTNVDRYEKGGARTTNKQSKELFASSMARRARMKQQGLQVPGMGNTATEKTTAVGQKRKRGLVGITKVGDDWFDKADRELEELKYESEDEEDDDDTNDAEEKTDQQQNRTKATQTANTNAEQSLEKKDADDKSKHESDAENATKRAKSLLGNSFSNTETHR